MKSLKRESTNCTNCGVAFNGTNKFYKRALCIPCGKVWQDTYAAEHRKPVEEFRRNKFSEFLVENREKYYSAILAETKGMEREVHKEWLINRFNEILQNKLLWEYITTQIPAHKKKKPIYQVKISESSKGLLENF